MNRADKEFFFILLYDHISLSQHELLINYNNFTNFDKIASMFNEIDYEHNK